MPHPSNYPMVSRLADLRPGQLGFAKLAAAVELRRCSTKSKLEIIDVQVQLVLAAMRACCAAGGLADIVGSE